MQRRMVPIQKIAIAYTRIHLGFKHIFAERTPARILDPISVMIGRALAFQRDKFESDLSLCRFAPEKSVVLLSTDV